MKTCWTRLEAFFFTLTILTLLPASADLAESGEATGKMTLRERGRYLVVIGGCNDCHTAGFAQAGATVPEAEWLTGDSVGWRGPWGTTYAVNLRLFVQKTSEEAWVKWARVARTQPPMPYWALNTMTDADLRAMYRFIKGLGPKGKDVPARLAPNQEPKTPFILFVPQAPK
jgi:mono/diheme cytochrome c family protein